MMATANTWRPSTDASFAARHVMPHIHPREPPSKSKHRGTYQGRADRMRSPLPLVHGATQHDSPESFRKRQDMADLLALLQGLQTHLSQQQQIVALTQQISASEKERREDTARLHEQL